MKHAEKNEVDLLLRSLGKRESRPIRTGAPQDHSGAEHLDADELNLYAEDVLPSATRARYTSHIADCASCRRIVTQLTLASGATVRRETLSPSSGATFWQKLAPFFSPSVLRFAAPALALFAVITVGIIAFRQQGEQVARNQTAPSDNPSLQRETSQLEAKEGHAYDSAPVNEKLSQQAPAGPAAEVKRKGQAEVSDTSKGGAAASGNTVSAAKANEPPATGGAVDRPAYATEPPPPAPKQPAEVARSEVAKERESQEEGRGQLLGTADARERDDARAQSKDEAAGLRPVSRRIQELPASNSVAQGRRSNEGADAKDKKQARGGEETRSVGGRRFRKDGNAWIDIAYNSSLSVVNVKRGSEQYRALIADEPGLRTIGEELKGVVVVVWKGRAYRIQ